MTRWRDLDDEFNEIETPELDAEEHSTSLDGLDALNNEASDSTMIDRGFQDVQVANLPQSDDLKDASDWHKVTQDEMRDGIGRLQEMRPAIKSGVGANSDYWYEFDQQHGLSYEHGYQRVYDSFYRDSDAIRLEKHGDRYDVINGRHRIWLAKEMGIDTLPAHVIESKRR